MAEKTTEVIFLKHHLDYQEKDKAEVSPERANYFERTGVAKPAPKKKATDEETPKAADLVEAIKEAETVKELKAILPEDENRKTVIEAAEKKLLEVLPEEIKEKDEKSDTKKEKRSPAGPNAKK